mgnify:FL=1
MNLLLDTHLLLWWLNDDAALSDPARDVIANGSNTISVSAVVVWEIRIKQAIGKLELPDNFTTVLAAQPFDDLDVTSAHAHEAANLPLHHRDPFDRMLIAQVRAEKLRIMSGDQAFAAYDVPLISV